MGREPVQKPGLWPPLSPESTVVIHCPGAQEDFLATASGFGRTPPSTEGPEPWASPLPTLQAPAPPLDGEKTEQSAVSPRGGGRSSHLRSVAWFQKAQRSPPVFHSRQQRHPMKGHGDYKASHRPHPHRPEGPGGAQRPCVLTLVANSPLMCMSVRRLCVTPVDRKDTLSELGEVCATATCWWKCEHMACSRRITTERTLWTASRLFREPHWFRAADGGERGAEGGRRRQDGGTRGASLFSQRCFLSV